MTISSENSEGKEHTGEKVAGGMRKVSTFENVLFFCTIPFKIGILTKFLGPFVQLSILVNGLSHKTNKS